VDEVMNDWATSLLKDILQRKPWWDYHERLQTVGKIVGRFQAKLSDEYLKKSHLLMVSFTDYKTRYKSFVRKASLRSIYVSSQVHFKDTKQKMLLLKLSVEMVNITFA
jgi:hypothetical protein